MSKDFISPHLHSVQKFLHPALFGAARFPTLQHEQLALRTIDANDLEVWFNYLRADIVRQNISWRPTAPLDLQEFLIGDQWPRAQSQFKFAIVDKKTQSFIGSIGFHSLSCANRSAEIAYDLKPEFWGHGIMQFICSEICEWAFAEARLHRIQATVLEYNKASLRVLEKTGFVAEGLLRNYRVVDGQPCNYWILSKTPTSIQEKAGAISPN